MNAAYPIRVTTDDKGTPDPSDDTIVTYTVGGATVVDVSGPLPELRIKIWTNWYLENGVTAADLQKYVNVDIVLGCSGTSVAWGNDFKNDPLTINAYKKIYGKVRYTPKIKDLYTDSNRVNCNVQYALEKGLNNSPSPIDYLTKDIKAKQVIESDGLFIDVDSVDNNNEYLEFDQQTYQGGDINDLYLKIFTDDQFIRKQIPIRDRCNKQTITLNSA